MRRVLSFPPGTSNGVMSFDLSERRENIWGVKLVLLCLIAVAVVVEFSDFKHLSGRKMPANMFRERKIPFQDFSSIHLFEAPFIYSTATSSHQCPQFYELRLP